MIPCDSLWDGYSFESVEVLKKEEIALEAYLFGFFFLPTGLLPVWESSPKRELGRGFQWALYTTKYPMESIWDLP